MKMGRKHLVVAIGLLLLSIVYNIWVFTRKPAAAAAANYTPVMQQNAAPANAAAGAVDPMKVPPPPGVTLSIEPRWGRDPFRREGDRPVPPPAVVQKFATPVIGMVLMASDRRVAMVNGHLVSVGDAIDGGTVSDIQADSIAIKVGSEELRFSTKGPKK